MKSQVAELERKIGKQTLEIDFFQSVSCKRVERSADAASPGPNRAIYQQIEHETRPGSTARRASAMRSAVNVSKSSMLRSSAQPMMRRE